jgi:hypothetical protein
VGEDQTVTQDFVLDMASSQVDVTIVDANTGCRCTVATWAAPLDPVE